MIQRSRRAFLGTACSVLGFCLARPRCPAGEVQRHGLWLEHWVCDNFFGGYRAPRYTGKWDIPAEVNTELGGLPVNPKAVKFGAAIGLGDALRQFEILEEEQSFILIAAFWEQIKSDTKAWVNAQTLTITPDQWRRLWEPVTRSNLERLAAVVKDGSLDIAAARKRSLEIKARPPFSQAVIQVNPKIDKSQRRLQCSLRFNDLFDHLAPQAERDRQRQPAIWGKPIPALPKSPPRSFAKEPI
jgi:hypothetical protein